MKELKNRYKFVAVVRFILFVARTNNKLNWLQILLR